MKPCLGRACPLAKYLYDQAHAVKHWPLERSLQVPLLHAAQRVVDKDAEAREGTEDSVRELAQGSGLVLLGELSGQRLLVRSEQTEEMRTASAAQRPLGPAPPPPGPAGRMWMARGAAGWQIPPPRSQEVCLRCRGAQGRRLAVQQRRDPLPEDENMMAALKCFTDHRLHLTVILQASRPLPGCIEAARRDGAPGMRAGLDLMQWNRRWMRIATAEGATGGREG